MSQVTLLSADFATRLGMKRLVLSVLAASLGVNVLLAATVLIKDEQVTTILVPMGLSEVGAPLKISDASISKHYLTLVARDLLTLAMNQTPENTDFNRKKLLDYALPSAFSEARPCAQIFSGPGDRILYRRGTGGCRRDENGYVPQKRTRDPSVCDGRQPLRF